MKNMRKKSVAVLLGLAVAGLVSASAATLGIVDAGTLGAGSDSVESCDSDGVSVDFTTAYDNGRVEVRDVIVGSVDGTCEGLTYTIELLDALGGNSLGAVSGTVGLIGFEFSADFDSANVDAQAVYGVAISIAGVIV